MSRHVKHDRCLANALASEIAAPRLRFVFLAFLSCISFGNDQTFASKAVLATIAYSVSQFCRLVVLTGEGSTFGFFRQVT